MTCDHDLDSLRYPSAVAAAACEVGSALTAAAAVSPVICIIDKAIFASASGRQPMSEALRAGAAMLLRRPGTFVRDPLFHKIYAVFAGTYLAANALRGCQEWSWTPADAHGHTAALQVFAATCLANVPLSVWKDKHFTRALGRWLALLLLH